MPKKLKNNATSSSLESNNLNIEKEMKEYVPNKSTLERIVDTFKLNLKESVVPGRGIDKDLFKRGLEQFRSIWKETQSGKKSVNYHRNMEALNEIKEEYINRGVNSEALDKYLNSWGITSSFRFRSLFKWFESAVIEQEYLSREQEKRGFDKEDITLATKDELETNKDLKNIKEKDINTKASDTLKINKSNSSLENKNVVQEKDDKEYLDKLKKELDEAKKHQQDKRVLIEVDFEDEPSNSKPNYNDKLDWDFTKSVEENKKEQDARKLDDLMNNFLDK